MSAPTVRWGVTTDLDGQRVRMSNGGKPASWSLKQLALQEAADEALRTPERDPRIVKITRKAKPKVVAKTVATYASSGNCICCDQADGYAEAGKIYRALRAAAGKRVRITIEDLSDE